MEIPEEKRQIILDVFREIYQNNAPLDRESFQKLLGERLGANPEKWRAIGRYACAHFIEIAGEPTPRTTKQYDETLERVLGSKTDTTQ